MEKVARGALRVTTRKAVVGTRDVRNDMIVCEIVDIECDVLGSGQDLRC